MKEFNFIFDKIFFDKLIDANEFYSISRLILYYVKV